MGTEDEEAASRSLRRKQIQATARIVGSDVEYVALDLSIGGIFLAGAPQLPSGTEVAIEVALAEPLTCRGVVRWVRGQRLSPTVREGMGIAFRGLSAEDLARITQLVEGA